MSAERGSLWNEPARELYVNAHRKLVAALVHGVARRDWCQVVEIAGDLRVLEARAESRNMPLPLTVPGERISV